MSQIIEITVSTTGQAQVQTKGFLGSGCRQASSFIELALGSRTGEQLTSEFHQQAGQQAGQQSRND
jgi:hypothetical protein